MLRALAVTGGVITSAGIVLAGTFSVLAVLPLVFLTEIGFVVAFGVLLDTFLVRSVLVPAIAIQLGPRFWWPSAAIARPSARSARLREPASEPRMRSGRAAPGGRRRCGGRARRRRRRRASAPGSPSSSNSRWSELPVLSSRTQLTGTRARRAGAQQRALHAGRARRATGERSQNGRSRPTSSSDSAQSQPPAPRRGRAPGAPAPARPGGRASRCRRAPRRRWPPARRRSRGSIRAQPRRQRGQHAEARGVVVGARGAAARCRCGPSRSAGRCAGVSSTPITLRERPRPGHVEALDRPRAGRRRAEGARHQAVGARLGARSPPGAGPRRRSAPRRVASRAAAGGAASVASGRSECVASAEQPFELLAARSPAPCRRSARTRRRRRGRRPARGPASSGTPSGSPPASTRCGRKAPRTTRSSALGSSPTSATSRTGDEVEVERLQQVAERLRVLRGRARAAAAGRPPPASS